MAGELCLYSWRFRALLYKTHFTLSQHEADEIRPDFKRVPPAIRAICLEAYPLQAPQPRIRLTRDAIRYTPFQYRQYYVALTGTFDHYLATFNSKHRIELKHALRRFEAASGGAIDVRTYATPDEMPSFHRLARAVSVRTYQHRLIDAGIPDGGDFTEWLRDSAVKGRIIGHVLFLGGEPVAFEYSRVTPEGIVIGERTGYDPARSRFAPGMVLLCCVIRSLFDAQRFRLLDFSGGEARYKALLSTHCARCGDIYYFRRSWANALRVVAHAGLVTANRLAVRLLQAVGLRERLKRLLRRATAPVPAARPGAAVPPAERPRARAAAAGVSDGTLPSHGLTS